MNSLQILKNRLKVDMKILIIYIVLYFTWGCVMNEFGIYAEIARFMYRFQIFTCYILFMIPVSLILRGLPWHQQYAYGVVLMGCFEFGGYALGTSIIYEDNIISQLFNQSNFSLAMTLFFGTYFPLGNAAVKWIAKTLKL